VQIGTEKRGTDRSQAKAALGHGIGIEFWRGAFEIHGSIGGDRGNNTRGGLLNYANIFVMHVAVIGSPVKQRRSATDTCVSVAWLPESEPR
jgi:hypothetical protein